MAELSGEARDRVRALGLWLVGGILLAGVLVGLYATLVGFDRVSPAAVDAVARTAEGRDLLVRYIGGSPGCGDPHRIDVTEDDETVVISAYTVAPHGTRAGFGCDDRGVVMLQTVRLGEPLGERQVRDGARDSAVVVHDSPAALLDGAG
ncbi:hypothetical protein [Georgenia subflava]|uniref:Uncharacterized protein n=1 Tax=Georgenia subflava TaxID=1622177 RepID=A0A6N7EM67_9MICO|nr:hypothetical protein [Georgenia subflava]MPV36344.1 hypothetical protein [Georgenia subflava]